MRMDTFSLLIMAAFYLITAYNDGRSLSFALGLNNHFNWTNMGMRLYCYDLFSSFSRGNGIHVRCVGASSAFHLSAAVFTYISSCSCAFRLAAAGEYV